ncbi:MAG: transcriptional regulator BetI [Rhizobiaceae bacterium]
MPKLGMEPIRRKELISAAIAAIHARGSLDITIRDIAARAGVSQGLAHHYFGSKDRLIVASMRYLLTQFSRQASAELKNAHTPRQRLSAIVNASLGEEQFRPEVVTSWLVFYVHSHASIEARQLLSIYTRRLHSNLVHDLRPLVGNDAVEIAQGIGAMIDGIYIRHSLGRDAKYFREGHRLVEDYIDLKISFAQAAAAKPNGA